MRVIEGEEKGRRKVCGGWGGVRCSTSDGAKQRVWRVLSSVIADKRGSVSAIKLDGRLWAHALNYVALVLPRRAHVPSASVAVLSGGRSQKKSHFFRAAPPPAKRACTAGRVVALEKIVHYVSPFSATDRSPAQVARASTPSKWFTTKSVLSRPSLSHYVLQVRTQTT